MALLKTISVNNYNIPIRFKEVRYHYTDYISLYFYADLDDLNLLASQPKTIQIYYSKYKNPQSREKIFSRFLEMAEEKVKEVVEASLEVKAEILENRKKGKEEREKIEQLFNEGKFEEAFELNQRKFRKVVEKKTGIDLSNCQIVEASNKLKCLMISKGVIGADLDEWIEHDRFILCFQDKKVFKIRAFEKYSIKKMLARLFNIDTSALQKFYTFQGDLLILENEGEGVALECEKREQTELGHHVVKGEHLLLEQKDNLTKIYTLTTNTIIHPEHEPITLQANKIYELIQSIEGD